MVKKTDTRTLKQKLPIEVDCKLLHCGQCAYRTAHKGSLNRHKLICKKYIYSRLSLLEKEAQLRVEVAGKPEHNPRKSGRKPFKEYRCKECNMLFATAVLRSEHKRRKSHKTRE